VMIDDLMVNDNGILVIGMATMLGGTSLDGTGNGVVTTVDGKTELGTSLTMVFGTVDLANLISVTDGGSSER